jgi:Ca2+-binding RTX toxin-like protein
MPAPVKSVADFELVNTENPEGEPWLAASPDGRFTLTFFESFTSPSAYTDIETRLYSAAGTDTGQGVAPTFSSLTIEHQAANAYLPDGRQVFVWTEEPTAGGGNAEDVYASIYIGSLVAIPRFLVAGGAGLQHDPVVAASANGGFVVALADDSVAGGRLTLKFYNNAGTLISTVLDATAFEGVHTPAGFEDDYRNVEITGLANGNYVVTWSDDANLDIFARIFSAGGVALTGLIDIEPGGNAALWPEVTALADGRFLVTNVLLGTATVRGRIFESDGTPSTGAFSIATLAATTSNQQVQTAALHDGRFVTVYRNLSGNIEGQVMTADGTPDGAVFAVNADAAGDKGRPTIATLADGRFAVSWESGAGATATIFTTIFDPREEGLDGSSSSLSDDWIGTSFGDTVYLGLGNDKMSGAAGSDRLRGEAGNDTLFGDGGGDELNGGGNNDTLSGGNGRDTLFGQLGNDVLRGEAGDDTLVGGSGMDELLGGTENDVLSGGAGDDSLEGSQGLDTLRGGDGADLLIGGSGNDTLLGGAAADLFDFDVPDDGNDTIGDWSSADGDTLQVSASGFGGGLAAGALAADRLVVAANPTANQAFGQFLYNTGTGQLRWDADGTGAGAAVNVAKLLNGGAAVSTLNAADFEILV